MKKITLILTMLLLITLSWQGNTQTLNEPAAWPNATWTISGTYNADPLAFEADPTATANFAFDDDDAGNPSDDNINAESPVYDLTAAHTAGETLLNLNADYHYRYLTNDQLQIEYWDADTSTWVFWDSVAATASTENDNFCAGAREALTILQLNINGFTATQLSGFQYRIAYDDDPAGGDWNYGFCFDAPTLTSETPPACIAPSAQTANPTSLTDVSLGWTENDMATMWDIEIVDLTAAGTPTGTPTNTGVTNPFTETGLTSGNDYEFYVRADCGGGLTSDWVGPVSWSQPTLGSTCVTPITAAVEVDCSAATPNTIDYSTAADLGTTDLSCDTFGVNTGAWFEFTAPAGGAVKVTFTDTNEYALFDSCGGTQLACVNIATNQADLTGLTAGVVYKLAVWKDSAITGTTDVCIEEVSCIFPSALSASVTSATEANISWTSGNAPAETEWEYVSQAPGTGAPAGAGTPTTTNPTMLTGLTDGDSYEFYVRAKCGPTTFSDWVGPFQWDQIVPPANDNCAGVIDLGTLTSPHSASTAGAVNDFGQDCLTNAGAPDVVYSVLVPDGYTLDIQQDSNTYDSKHRLAYGTACPGDMLIVCTDDPDTNTESWENTTGADQTVYWIQSAWGTDSGDYTLSWLLTPPPACPDVANLSASNFTAPDSADLTWDAATGATGYNWEIQPQGIAQGTAGAIAMGTETTNTATATGLVDGTDYTLYVQSDCGAGVLGNFISLDFSFLIPPANDNCTGVIDLGTLTSPHSASTAGAVNDFGQDCLTNAGAPDVVYSVLVPDGYTLDIQQDSNTYDSKHRLAYGAACPGDMFIVCTDDPDTNTESWENTTGADQTVYWIQSAYSTASGDYTLSWLLTPPTCGDPSALTATNILDVSADLGWTAGADAETMWDVQWGAVGFTPEVDALGMVADTMDNPYSATGLTASTDYEFYVRAKCPTLNSAWVGPFAFTTLAPQPPVNNDCLDATALTVGSSRNDNQVLGTNLNATDSMETAPSCAQYTGGDVWYSAVVPATGNITIETMPLPGGGGDGGLAVYSGACGALTQIECNDDGGDGAFSLIDLTGQTPGDTLLIRVWEYFGDAIIDFNVVAYNTTCFAPSNLSAINITGTSADLGWDENNAVPATVWDIEWGTTGFVQGAGTMVAGETNNPYSLTGLMAGGTYDFYVRSECGVGDSSDWAGPFTFNTVPDCPDVANLVADNFAQPNSANVSWDAVAGATGYNWEIQLQGVAQGDAGVISSGSTTDPTLMDTATGLVDGTDYTLYVQSDCGGGMLGRYIALNFTFLPPPTNDMANDAIAVACGDTVTGNTSVATLDNQGDCGAGSTADANNMWYTFTGTGAAEDVTLALCNSGYDTSVGVYTGTPGALVCLASNDDSGSCVPNGTRSQVTFTSDGTQTYYIAVEGYRAFSNGAFEMVVSCAPACTPAVTNQDCASALMLTIDAAAVTSDNTCATTNINNPTCDPFGVIADVWFSFVAPANGLVDVTTVLGTATEVNLAVYSGACGTLVEENCIDTAAVANSLNLNGLVAGDTYFVQAWNDGETTLQEGTFDIEVTGIPVSLPDCPTLVSPIDGATGVLSPVVLDWDAATTGDPADSYNLYVSINGGAEQLFANYTVTETPAIGLQPDLTIVWRITPVNAAGENTACTTTFTFSSVIGTDDYDGDGVDNLTEYDPNADGDLSDATDMTDPCDPVQVAGYVGYDSANAIWSAADCDGDLQSNQEEFDGGSDPYDANSTVSINDLEAVGFRYYPNPVQDDLHLTANENITNVVIFNMIGQEVKRVTPSTLDTTIDMSNLANGTYFVKATVGSSVGSFKIVKK